MEPGICQAYCLKPEIEVVNADPTTCPLLQYHIGCLRVRSGNAYSSMLPLPAVLRIHEARANHFQSEVGVSNLRPLCTRPHGPSKTPTPSRPPL